jgi:hypothetical protein
VSALLESVDSSVVERGIGADVQTMSIDKVFWSHFSVRFWSASASISAPASSRS